MVLDFNREIQLENDIVLLRPLREADFEVLFPYAAKHPDLWQYSLVSANSKDRMKAYLAKAIKDKKAASSYPFIVWDKRQEAYAGSTRFYDYQAHHQTVQLGYTWYGKDFWGTGLNKNCKFLMLQFAFETLGLERVEFRADNNNKRSIAAMKSLGCTVEGVLRQNCASQDGRRDSIILSILKEEWETSVKQQLLNRI